MKADGSGKRQITNNGKANFAPFLFPDGKRIIFASNMDDPRGRNFDLYSINIDGTGLERITFNETFDGFPMFSPRREKARVCSNRNAKAQGETNIFIADWVPWNPQITQITQIRPGTTSASAVMVGESYSRLSSWINGFYSTPRSASSA